MPVAGLTKVTLRCRSQELGLVVARLCGFGEFHPSRREGMGQDTGILLLGSRIQAVYSRADELLNADAFKRVSGEPASPESFEARDLQSLAGQLEDYLTTIENNVTLFKDEADKVGIRNLILSIRETAQVLFRDTLRILVLPSQGGYDLLEGYVPTSSLKSFRGLLGEYVLSTEELKKRGRYDPYVPTLLRNPRLVSVFESLTLQKGLPKYSEIDPTPAIALVFPLFFGMMFADVGHGIVLMAAGLYLRYRTKYAYWGALLLVLGVSAFAVGLLRGVVFGFLFETPLSNIGLPPSFSTTVTAESVTLLLEVAVIFGTFHLASGYLIALLDQLRAGDLYDALLARLPTLTLYASAVPAGLAVIGNGVGGSLLASDASTPVFDDLLGLSVPVWIVASISLPILAASFVVLIAGHPIKEYHSTRKLKKAVLAIGSGLADAAIRLAEFSMNTISYVRLGVLLITTTLLGSLVADVTSIGALGIVLAVFINIAVIALEGIIVYVQDMRLQLYEWSTEFYSGTGAPFLPLLSNGRYFRVRWVSEPAFPSGPLLGPFSRSPSVSSS